MTPLSTFQWPLSPSGTTQPAKSLPLNSDVNLPLGAAAFAPAATGKQSTRTETRARAVMLPSYSISRRNSTGTDRKRNERRASWVRAARRPRGAVPTLALVLLRGGSVAGPGTDRKSELTSALAWASRLLAWVAGVAVLVRLARTALLI